MNFFEKKIIYKLPVLILCFLFCDSIYGTDRTGFFDDLFSFSEKTPHKAPASPIPLSSYNPQLSRSQNVISDQVNPLSQQAGAFLQAFPKILREMTELERHIPTLIPDHPRNPANLCRYPRRGDWRVLMVWPVKEDLDPGILPNDLDIGKKNKALKQEKVKKEKEIKEKITQNDLKNLDNHPLDGQGRNLLAKMAQEEHLRAMVQLPGMLRLWFLQNCNPGSQSLRNFLQDYGQFSQWWDDLAPELTKSQNILLLYSLLRQENHGTMILSLLDELLVQSLLLKSQSLYEELLPTFMDLKTSSRTLRSLREEASREDDVLREILQNGDLYEQIESYIAQAIESAVTPLMEECLKQTTDDGLKQTVREVFQQAMKDALTAKSDSLQEKVIEKRQDSIITEVDKSQTLKENLQKAIVNVIRETINGGLNQAAGRANKGEPLQSSLSWGTDSKKTKETSKHTPGSLDKHSLAADITSIIQTLSEFIKPPLNAA